MTKMMTSLSMKIMMIMKTKAILMMRKMTACWPGSKAFFHVQKTMMTLTKMKNMKTTMTMLN